MVVFLKKFAVALAMVGAMGASNATPVQVNLGQLNNTLTYTHLDISGVFDDVLSFQATTLLGAVANIVSFDFFGDLDGSYRVGVGDSWDTVTWLTGLSGNLVAVDDIVSAYSLQLPTLTSGQTYWLEITGEVSDGSYTAKVVPSSVPEPGSLLLVLLGAGALVVVARRRQSKTENKAA